MISINRLKFTNGTAIYYHGIGIAGSCKHSAGCDSAVLSGLVYRTLVAGFRVNTAPG